MTTEETLHLRAGDQCELSGAQADLVVYAVPPSDGSAERFMLISAHLLAQREGAGPVRPDDWRCLNDSMWSEVPAVKVVAYRMLQQLMDEGWPADLLAMMYMDDDSQAWAERGADAGAVIHRDSNGHVLSAGDTVLD
jgi:protein PhnA